MFFTNIEINNFRNIKSLQLNNIKQINLLTGRNNCGKTSILEAIFLLVGMSNPNLALNIHKFRDISLTDNEEFSFLFNEFDFSRNPVISGKINSQERTLEIKPKYHTNKEQFTEKIDVNDSNNFTSNASSASSSYEDNPKLEKIEFNYRFNNQESNQSLIKLQQGQAELFIPPSYRETLKATFLSPNNIIYTLSEKLEQVIINKELNLIIESLKQIEPKLKDIRIAKRGLVYADIGFDQLVPINIMGDGMIRILGILASISENKDGILIIDEIENGFHYSTLSILWKAILSMANQNNVQLFIATHSYECIEAFIEVYQNMKKDLGEDFVSLFRIESDAEEQHKSFQYDAETLFVGVEEEFEVR